MSNKNSKRKSLSNEQLKNAAGGGATHPKIFKSSYFDSTGKLIEYDPLNPFEGLSYDERQALAKELKRTDPKTYERFVN